MAWYIRNTGELWTGPTHTLHGFTWTEVNHMSYSVKLEEGPEPVKARTKKGTFKADDHPSPAFYIASGARIALSENYITHWLQLPPLPGDESGVEDDV